MIWKWLSRNWLGVITAIGVLYGIIMSTYNFIEYRKTKKRRLGIKITYGKFSEMAEGPVTPPLLFIDIANIGYCPITISAPYFEVAGHRYEPLEVVADVKFPAVLEGCKACSRAIRIQDVIQYFATSCGLSGEVFLRAVVKDATGKLWRAKKSWRLGLRDGKQGKRGARLEQKAIEKNQAHVGQIPPWLCGPRIWTV